MKTGDEIKIIDVGAENVSEAGIYCIKNKKSPGFCSKVEWFKSMTDTGLKIKIAVDSNGNQLGFIEYLPSELAWRPIKARHYLFIQCIALFTSGSRQKGIGSLLIRQCEKDANASKKAGICTMCSDGAWMANKTLFEKNGFAVAERLDRFELMIKPFMAGKPKPRFIDWTKEQSKYRGWHLVYSDQCPWHEKSVTDLRKSAKENGIELNVRKLLTPAEAQNAPSGFGTFSLIRDGKLLADHYISKTRFENILKEEMKT